MQRIRSKVTQATVQKDETQQEKLNRLLKSKNLTDSELKELVDIGGEVDETLKSIEKEAKAVKEFLKSYVEENKMEDGIEGENWNFTISAKNTTTVTKSPTEFIRFLKSIGKLDIVDSVLSVPLTTLKKYVDVITLEREGILETKTNPFGTARYKKR